MVATSAKSSRPSPLALAAKRPALVVVQPHRLPAELLTQNPVLLTQVIDDLQLALVHPPGNGDQHEPERLQDSGHLVSHYRER
jgi:hypothetical protein